MSCSVFVKMNIIPINCRICMRYFKMKKCSHSSRMGTFSLVKADLISGLFFVIILKSCLEYVIINALNKTYILY